MPNSSKVDWNDESRTITVTSVLPPDCIVYRGYCWKITRDARRATVRAETLTVSQRSGNLVSVWFQQVSSAIINSEKADAPDLELLDYVWDSVHYCHPLRGISVDGIPWEIHAIGDLATRQTAINAWRSEQA